MVSLAPLSTWLHNHPCEGGSHALARPHKVYRSTPIHCLLPPPPANKRRHKDGSIQLYAEPRKICFAMSSSSSKQTLSCLEMAFSKSNFGVLERCSTVCETSNRESKYLSCVYRARSLTSECIFPVQPRAKQLYTTETCRVVN